MKRLSLILAVVLLFPNVAQADFYVKEVTHVKSYFLGILIGSEEESVSELWIGDNRIALVEEGRTLIVDLDRNSFIFINPFAETYVEASLPLTTSEILSEDVKRQYEKRRPSGRVEKTDGTREFLQKDYTEYEVTYWDLQDGKRSNRRTFQVWATTDVPFDLTLYYEVLMNMRKIYNRHDRLRRELQKIEGLQMGMEMEMEGTGIAWSKKLVTEVVEVSEKEPPADVYSVPAGYAKKEFLSPKDLGVR